jgi:hypothetical protein
MLRFVAVPMKPIKETLTRGHSGEGKGEEDGKEELEEAHPSHIFLQNLIQGLPLLLS